ncbi:DNA-binding protein [Acinetobacter baumannii]|uniref:DNA-binding protein n=1 Tax=Acinetobacter calcoaceticus/baumannii complex TaxID=909768 RepID=UPI000CE38DD7|nr:MULTISPECIES: DNA-binding protein [Acinetobacter calcoaceticus/baumannii complex]EKU1551227.1 DNA-binding protein [Acinetobacter baumannii]EKU2690904.1 DNA-binding protein [Acinetobacter baumannii]EKU5255708.1 DNA-binding protein [Acinetobacter baumannii]EKU6962093.1 DNA-binding protein [Acinetobacter baumannii]EKU7213391.1 DNA-binding protein [Acinetobacter baumannii]
MGASIPIIKLIEAMNEQPIAFNKHYVFLGCGINGALMLSQLVYWTSRTKDSEGWIFKTHHEWTQETGLTRREQDTARATLKSLKFISEKKMGVPRRVYYRVERENLYQALIEYSESIDINSMHNSAILNAQNSHTECTNPPDCMHNSAILNAQIRPSNTENTYREYTENTTDIICADSAPKTQKFKAKDFLLKNGVSEQTATEYLDLRNKKKKPVTQRALQLVFKQAQEAKLSNERVFQIIVVRGWESFKAAWNWQETNAELEQLENPVVEQQETAPRNAPVLLRKEYKGAK